MIRPATLADIPWLIEAGALAQQEAPHYADLPSDPADQYKRLVGILQFPEAVCLQMVDDCTGFVCGALEPAVWFQAVYAVQNLLWVHPNHRGTRRAWELVRAFEQWARRQGANRLIVGISSGVLEDRTSSFYGRMGYQQMGPAFYKEVL